MGYNSSMCMFNHFLHMNGNTLLKTILPRHIAEFADLHNEDAFTADERSRGRRVGATCSKMKILSSKWLWELSENVNTCVHQLKKPRHVLSFI